LQEQQGQPEQWLGAKAPDAVFIRLQHDGGVITSTVDSEVDLVQHQESKEAGGGQRSSTLIVIKWCGSSFSVSCESVIKVSADCQQKLKIVHAPTC
jgi:hypothetical protein